MDRSPRGLRRRAPAFISFTLAAAAAFVALRPGLPGADGGSAPLAVAGPVQLFGDLVREGEGWAVQVRAVNAGRPGRRCRITATVTELRSNPMSRVLAIPRPRWSADVALAVPAGRAARARVAVPAELAASLSATAAGPRTPEGAATVTHGVQLDAACAAPELRG